MFLSNHCDPHKHYDFKTSLTLLGIEAVILFWEQGIYRRAIVNCCVLRNSLSGGFLHDSVLEGTSFDDEGDLFVAA